MLKQHPTLVKQLIAFTDTVLITVSFVVAYQMASQWDPLDSIESYWVMYVGLLFFYLYFGWTNSLYSVLHFGWMQGLADKIVVIFSSAGVLGASILYLMPDDYHGRKLYLTYGWLAFVLVGTEKLLLRHLFARMRRRGRNTTPVMLFGRGRMLSQVTKEIEGHPEWGLKIRRKVDIDTPLAQFADILMTDHVEQVFFAVPRGACKAGFVLDPFLRLCADVGRTARVFLNITEATHFSNWHYENYLGRASMLSYTAELDPDQLLLKRALDIAGAVVGCAVLVLTFPLFAVAIKLTSPGPVFFRQLRVGRNGKLFGIYKYRTMVVDAEERKRELMENNELNGAVFKMKDDPRVTRVGSILRRLSLDEWPQFINVLRGQMSLVGTRPPTPDEVANYEKWHHRRISIKPGLTGMWQVSGRNRITDFDDIVRLDLQYIDNWSLWLDLKIMLRTIIVVFKKDEAY